MRFFDGINHPDAATVAADGLDGAMLYLGTPSSGKDLTAAQYADYKAHGLRTVVGFEHVVDDWRGGPAAGRANGAAFLADAHAKGVSLDDPFWVAGADQHVAPSDLPTVVAYVKAYVVTVRAGEWRGRAGGYGFPEVTTALHNAGVVDWYWGAGRRADQPPWINIWQDNTQTIQVGGSADDIDWILTPLPQETDMASDFNSSDAAPAPGTYGWDVLHLREVGDHPDHGFAGIRAAIDTLGKQITGAISKEEADLLAKLAGITQPQATVSAADLETALRAVIGGGFDVTVTPKAAP